MSTSALGPMSVVVTEGEPASSAEGVLRVVWWIAITLLVAVVLLLAWLVRVGGFFVPGDDFGYNLGLVGGILMLTLLLYPLRKRSATLSRLGDMANWFKYHMVAGIGGPLLVLFHSTFRTESMNAAMALYSMLLVALSGILGRFIYRHTHRGLYGKRLTIEDATGLMKSSAENLESVFALRPDIEPRLKAFEAEAFRLDGGYLVRVWRFFTLRMKSQRLALAIRHDAKAVLVDLWRKEGGPRRVMVFNYRLARNHVDEYFDSVVKAAQLSVWEKLFSYWHLLHIPFLYLLILSGVVHVVAVHMY